MVEKSISQEQRVERTMTAGWYIVQKVSKQCEIVSGDCLETSGEEIQTDTALSLPKEETEEENIQKWGPFETQNQAIAKRIGLIRAGKCQPS